MKLLFVCQSYYPEQFKITDIAESMVDLGHDVTVLTGLPNYPKGKIYPGYRWFKNRRQLINGVKIKRAWLIARGKSKIRLFINYVSFFIAASILSLFDNDNYDAVICYQLSPITMAIPAIIQKKRKKIPFLLYCLDLWPESVYAGGIRSDSFIYRVVKRFSIWIYKQANKIVVSSPSFESYFHNVIGIQEPIEPLFNYAEEIFKPVEVKSNTGVTNLYFAGNLGNMSSVITILKAANHLRDNSSIQFHIVGDGTQREYLEQYVRDHSLSNVKMYGHISLEEMPHIYHQADAMIITLTNNPIISYTIPNKVQSYMAMGKPIIGAINGAVNEIIETSGCGYCAPAEDWVGLSRVIVDFSHSSMDQRMKMAQNSLEYYEENFSKTIFFERITDYLNMVINE